MASMRRMRTSKVKTERYVPRASANTFSNRFERNVGFRVRIVAFTDYTLRKSSDVRAINASVIFN